MVSFIIKKKKTFIFESFLNYIKILRALCGNKFFKIFHKKTFSTDKKYEISIIQMKKIYVLAIRFNIC